MKIETLARIVHEANRAYCLEIEQYDQTPWEVTPKIIQHSAIQGIKALAANPELTPEQMHENWMDYKLDEGWGYGETKDIEAKTHPCLMQYDNLPEFEKVKDLLFHSIVHAFLDELEWDEMGGVDIEVSTVSDDEGVAVVPGGVDIEVSTEWPAEGTIETGLSNKVAGSAQGAATHHHANGGIELKLQANKP